MGYHKDDPLFFCIFGKNEEKISKNLKNLESTRIKTPYLLFIVKKYGVLSTLCAPFLLKRGVFLCQKRLPKPVQLC